MSSGLEADYAVAVRRAEVKRALAEGLQALPPADRRSVLLDLLAEFTGATKAAVPMPVPSAVSAATPRGRGRPMKRRANGGKFSGLGRTEALLSVLAPNPRMAILDLAAKVYGGHDATGSKTRSLLFSLKKQDRVKSVGPGLWEVVA